MDDILKQIQQMQLPDKPAAVNETAQTMLAERMEKLGLRGSGGESYRSLGGFVDHDFEDVNDRKAFARRIVEKNVQSLPFCQGTVRCWRRATTWPAIGRCAATEVPPRALECAWSRSRCSRSRSRPPSEAPLKTA